MFTSVGEAIPNLGANIEAFSLLRTLNRTENHKTPLRLRSLSFARPGSVARCVGTSHSRSLDQRQDIRLPECAQQ